MRDVNKQSRQLDRAWLTAFAILLSLAGYLANYKSGPVPLKAEFATFPVSLRNWSGQEGEPQKVAFRVRGADHELVRTYYSPSGREFKLYVAYFESQRQSKEIVNWLTARLHKNSTVMDIPIDQRVSISINYIANHPFSHKNESVGRNGQSKRDIFFWYTVNGRILADQYNAKFATTLDALKYGRTNGAFVLVSAASADQEDEKEVIREGRALIQDLVPVLHRYLK